MGHFYFVRHGQTVWNVENKICGATDIALTEYGHEQAVLTGKKILEEGIQADEILYSPLVRAADTAKHISELTGIPRRMEPRLIEQNFGKWESTPRDGLDFRRPRNSSHAATRAANRRCASPREFIICWTTSKLSQMRRPTYLLLTTALPALFSRISLI